MTQQEYGNAEANMIVNIEGFTKNDYFKSLIPEQITKSLEVLIEFIMIAKSSIFIDGKLLSLSIFNIFKWWAFVKVTYDFIKKIVEIWK